MNSFLKVMGLMDTMDYIRKANKGRDRPHDLAVLLLIVFKSKRWQNLLWKYQHASFWKQYVHIDYIYTRSTHVYCLILPSRDVETLLNVLLLFHQSLQLLVFGLRILPAVAGPDIPDFLLYGFKVKVVPVESFPCGKILTNKNY